VAFIQRQGVGAFERLNHEQNISFIGKWQASLGVLSLANL
jgi:hypothetical protein